jgi:phage terminase small subunit
MASTKPDRPLSNKQAAFVREYILDFCGSKAAIRAGYSPKNAGRIAYQLLENNLVNEAIAETQRQIAATSKITRDWLVKETRSILEAARQDKAHSAAFRGAELLAKLTGNLIERRETRQVTDWSDLSEEELRALAAADQARVEEGKTRH